MKNFKIILCVLLVLMLFAGCTERNNLSELSVVEGMGIDYKNGEVALTIQTLNLAKEGSGAEALSGNVTMTSSGTGINISEAIENVTESLSKKLFFGQNRIIVFGKDMAENHIEKNLDYLLRSAESRSDITLCISEKDAASVLESKENDALVPAQSITSLLKTGEERGFAADVTTHELLNLYLDKTSDIYLPVVSSDEESVSVSGIAVYSNEKLVKILDDSSTFGFLFLLNKIDSGLMNVKSPELGNIGVEIIKSKTKLRASTDNGVPLLHADIKAQLMLDAVENGLTTTLTRRHLREIEKLTQDEITKMCTRAFNDCVTNGSDCLRIGERLAMSSPKDYDKLSDNWDDVVPEAKLEVNVTCELKKINENSKGS